MSIMTLLVIVFLVVVVLAVTVVVEGTPSMSNTRLVFLGFL